MKQLTIILALILYSSVLHAQTGVIFGNVTADDAPAEGLTVHLSKASFKLGGTVKAAETSTSITGYFEFNGLEPAVYSITVFAKDGSPTEFKEYVIRGASDTVDTGVLTIKLTPDDSTGSPVIINNPELIINVSVLSDTASTGSVNIYDCIINEVTKGDLSPGEYMSMSLSKTSLQTGLFTKGSVLILSFYEIKTSEGGNNSIVLSGFADKLGRMWKLIKAEKPGEIIEGEE